MKNKTINRILSISYGIGATLALVGAIFMIKHYPNARTIILIGSILGSATFIIDGLRTKNQAKQDDSEISNKE